MTSRQAPASRPTPKTDPHGELLPRDRDERYDGGEDYDARGGQFFGTPGDYGRRQGWLDGHLVGRERALATPPTGYDDARHGRRQAGVYGGTGPFAWPGKPDSGRSGGEDAAFDPDYRRWRSEQLRALDDDYRAYRGERYQKFSDDFGAWRTARALTKGPTRQPEVDGQPDGGQVASGQQDEAGARRGK